jgi:hypothetical protein
MEESRLAGLEEVARLEREEALEKGCLSVEEMYMYEARHQAEAEAKAAEAAKARSLEASKGEIASGGKKRQLAARASTNE